MSGCRVCGQGDKRLCDVHALERYDEDEWDPEPASHREGETRDDDNSHAQANAEQIEMLSDNARTDGGSKYVRETGEGYLGVHTVSGSTISVGLATLPVDWTVGDDVWTWHVPEEGGVAITGTEPDDPIGVYTVREDRYSGTGQGGMLVLSLSPAAVAPLEVSHGDDVRVYERETGLLLVHADDDPRVGGDQA